MFKAFFAKFQIMELLECFQILKRTIFEFTPNLDNFRCQKLRYILCEHKLYTDIYKKDYRIPVSAVLIDGITLHDNCLEVVIIKVSALVLRHLA